MLGTGMPLDKRPNLHDQICAARHRDTLSPEDSSVQPLGAAPIKREPYAGVKETAHQRDIADAARMTSDRERLTSLKNAYVQMIEQDQAESIILKFEWLGDIGNTTKFVGLFTADKELIGVACFGSGPADKATNKRTENCAGQHIKHSSNKSMVTLLGGPCICLERGACVPHAPPNAASFLISHACKLMWLTTRSEAIEEHQKEKPDPSVQEVSRFFAYGDPEAGEYGAVYQAANWVYLGQGLMGIDKNGQPKTRKFRVKVLRPGDDPSKQRNWRTTRELRRPNKPPMRFAEALKRGYKIEKFPAKHVYAISVGKDAKKWSGRASKTSSPILRRSTKRSWRSRKPRNPYSPAASAAGLTFGRPTFNDFGEG